MIRSLPYQPSKRQSKRDFSSPPLEIELYRCVLPTARVTSSLVFHCSLSSTTPPSLFLRCFSSRDNELIPETKKLTRIYTDTYLYTSIVGAVQKTIRLSREFFLRLSESFASFTFSSRKVGRSAPLDGVLSSVAKLREHSSPEDRPFSGRPSRRCVSLSITFRLKNIQTYRKELEKCCPLHLLFPSFHCVSRSFIVCEKMNTRSQVCYPKRVAFSLIIYLGKGILLSCGPGNLLLFFLLFCYSA